MPCPAMSLPPTYDTADMHPDGENPATLQHIDKATIDTDLQARIKYLTDFIEFGPKDHEALRSVANIVRQQTPHVINAVYQKLFSFDITKQSFIPRGHGYKGPVDSTLDDVKQDSPQIKFRKDFVYVWAAKVFDSDYNDPATWVYFDKAGSIHTGKQEFKHRAKKDPLYVDYMHSAILLGFIQGQYVDRILASELPQETKEAVCTAINKFMWIQNDLFSRHYVRQVTPEEPAKPSVLTAIKTSPSISLKTSTIAYNATVLLATLFLSMGLTYIVFKS